MSLTRKKFEMELLWITDQQKAYLRAQEEHRQKGHRHPYCFHGTYQWVDYDAICPHCEDSQPDEHSSPEEIRDWFNENYGTSYDDDHLLWRFKPIAWGDDTVEVVRIHRYEAQRVPGKVCTMDYHNVICTLALVSDGTEFEMAMGTDELIIADPEAELEQDRAEEFDGDVW